MNGTAASGRARGGMIDRSLGRPLLTDVVVAAALAVVLGGMSVQILRAADIGVGSWLAIGSALALLHMCTAFARVRPRSVFTVAVLAVAVLALWPGVPDAVPGVVFPAFALPSVLVLGFLLFGAARVLPPLSAAVCLAVTLLIAAVVVVRLWDPGRWGRSTADGELVVWRVGLSVAVAASTLCVWALGRLSRLRDLHLGELRLRAERVEADRVREQAEAARAERDRISRELHDVVSHSLAVMVSQAEGGRLSDPEGRGATTFATIADVGREALRDMRGLLGVLRSDEAVRGPQPGLADLPALLSQVRTAGIVLQTEETGVPRRLRQAADLAAYRVIQEALTNVIKHAGPAPAVELALAWRPGRVVISIHDDGIGPTEGSGAPGPVGSGSVGSGLTGMAERLRAAGGTLELEGTAGAGFGVVAEIPYAPSSPTTERSLPSSA